MKLLDHPEFSGVEPLFATAFVFSTGKNVGRRVRCTEVAPDVVHFCNLSFAGQRNGPFRFQP
jgi:hypothetical protein